MDQRDAQLVREIMARVKERTSLLQRIQVASEVRFESFASYGKRLTGRGFGLFSAIKR